MRSLRLVAAGLGTVGQVVAVVAVTNLGSAFLLGVERRAAEIATPAAAREAVQCGRAGVSGSGFGATLGVQNTVEKF